jgi:hypothetical protein
MARQREHDRKQIARLRSLLARCRAGTPVNVAPPREADLAFEVSLNGKRLGSVTVDDPGTLTVTVFAKRRASKQLVTLDVHGGTQLDEATWRWYDWKWANRRLQVGDTVKIRVGSPRRAGPRHVRAISGPPSTPDAIADELKALTRRVRSNYYSLEAAAMRSVAKDRPPPRVYAHRSRRPTSR